MALIALLVLGQLLLACNLDTKAPIRSVTDKSVVSQRVSNKVQSTGKDILDYITPRFPPPPFPTCMNFVESSECEFAPIRWYARSFVSDIKSRHVVSFLCCPRLKGNERPVQFVVV